MNVNSAHDYALPVELVIKKLKRRQEVCDGLRGDAFVAAQEVGFDNLCEIVDERPRGIDTLINHMRGLVIPLTNESKELFCQYCRPGGPSSRQNGESMKQYDDDVAGRS